MNLPMDYKVFDRIRKITTRYKDLEHVLPFLHAYRIRLKIQYARIQKNLTTPSPDLLGRSPKEFIYEELHAVTPAQWQKYLEKMDESHNQLYLDFELYVTILNRIRLLLEIVNSHIKKISGKKEIGKKQFKKWKTQRKAFASFFAQVQRMRRILDHFDTSLTRNLEKDFGTGKASFGFGISNTTHDKTFWYGSTKLNYGPQQHQAILDHIEFVFGFLEKSVK
jgi:hypothetical protein